MKNFILLFVILVLSPAFAFAASPTITEVSGLLETGEMVIISGSNLIQEDRTNWDIFFKNNPNASHFLGTSPSHDGYGQLGPSGGIYDSNVSLLGNQSMRFRITGVSSVCPHDNLGDLNAINPDGGDTNEYWIRSYVRWNASGGWPTSHIKMIDCQGSGAQYYFQPSAGASLPSRWNATYDGKSYLFNNPSGQFQNNRWYVIEIHWRTNNTPYIFDAWVDNVKIVEANPSNPGSLNYLLFGIINACGTHSNFLLDHWLDGFAVSISRVFPASVVEIGNSPTYGEGNEKYQEPIFFSDEEIKIKVNIEGVGNGPFYLWVTNNRQERTRYDIEYMPFHMNPPSDFRLIMFNDLQNYK